MGEQNFYSFIVFWKKIISVLRTLLHLSKIGKKEYKMLALNGCIWRKCHLVDSSSVIQRKNNMFPLIIINTSQKFILQIQVFAVKKAKL